MSKRGGLHGVPDDTDARQFAERTGRARYWDPVVGDTLMGSVRKIQIAPGERLRSGIDTPVVIVDSDDRGEIEVWLGRVSLRRELFDVRPAPGAVIAIRYYGLREVQAGGWPVLSPLRSGPGRRRPDT